MKKKRISISDIANELGTTSSTVSRALNDHPAISSKMKEMVKECANRLNYYPNSAAQNLKSGRKKSIGVVVPLINRNFFSSAIEGIEDYASLKGYDVIICSSKSSTEREISVIESLKGKVDGIIITMVYTNIKKHHLELLKSSNVPLVFFDRIPSGVDASTVTIDDYNAVKGVVNHLIESGRKRIFHFAGDQNTSIWRLRCEGYKAAMAENNIEIEENWIHTALPRRAEGEKFAQKIVESGKPLPEAIVFTGDFAALGALIKFKELGVRIPEDIAITGFANEPFCDFLTPSLTSVEQHGYEIGKEACKIMLDELNGEPKKNVIINSKLIVRESTSPKNKK